MAREYAVRYLVPVWIKVDADEGRITQAVVETEGISEPLGYVPAELVSSSGWVDEDQRPLTVEVLHDLAEAEAAHGWPAWELGW